MDYLTDNLLRVIGLVTIVVILLDHLLWKFVLWYVDMKLAIIKASKEISLKEKQLEE